MALEHAVQDKKRKLTATLTKIVKPTKFGKVVTYTDCPILRQNVFSP